jgi:hypothetical protein
MYVTLVMLTYSCVLIAARVMFVLSPTSNFSATWRLSPLPVTARDANLDLCFALTALRGEGSFTYHTYCNTESPFLRSYPKDPWFSLLNAMLLPKEQSLLISNVLGLTRPARAGARTHDLPDAKRDHFHYATTTGNIQLSGSCHHCWCQAFI